MSETDNELETLFKKMLKDQEEVTKNDPIYNEDIKDSPLRVQWDTQDILAYQIFEKDNYSYKFGERLENPDLTITFNDAEAAKTFLKGDVIDYMAIPKKEFIALSESAFVNPVPFAICVINSAFVILHPPVV